jgi:hypothetical protein
VRASSVYIYNREDAQPSFCPSESAEVFLEHIIGIALTLAACGVAVLVAMPWLNESAFNQRAIALGVGYGLRVYSAVPIMFVVELGVLCFADGRLPS